MAQQERVFATMPDYPFGPHDRRNEPPQTVIWTPCTVICPCVHVFVCTQVHTQRKHNKCFERGKIKNAGEETGEPCRLQGMEPGVVRSPWEPAGGLFRKLEVELPHGQVTLLLGVHSQGAKAAFSTGICIPVFTAHYPRPSGDGVSLAV